MAGGFRTCCIGTVCEFGRVESVHIELAHFMRSNKFLDLWRERIHGRSVADGPQRLVSNGRDGQVGS